MEKEIIIFLCSVWIHNRMRVVQVETSPDILSLSTNTLKKANIKSHRSYRFNLKIAFHKSSCQLLEMLGQSNVDISTLYNAMFLSVRYEKFKMN